MYRAGHVGFNALLYAPVVPLVASHWSLELSLWGGLLAILTATVPDIDGLIPRIHHRSVTHTIWFALLVGTLTGTATLVVGLASPLESFSFGFLVGTTSVFAHLIGDVLTPMGISPLVPVSNVHVTFDRFKSKNVRINRALLLVGGLALLASITLTTAFTAASVTSPPVVW